MNDSHRFIRILGPLALAVGALPTVACSDPAPPPAGEAEAATAATAAALPSIHLVPAFPRLTFQRPVFITHAGDGSGNLFVVEQPGRIRVFPDQADADTTAVFLDIRDRVRDRHNEEGLLALAFHPRYAENRQLFVYYTASSPRRGVLARFTAPADAAGPVDPSTEKVLLEVEEPYGNHNGSTVLFGPDGFLYMSFGDGGAANDPHGNGQNLGTLLASILRIDVDHEEGGRPYAIPADNPFVNRAGARGEIWAYGLRNVWRMSFDRETGDLWAGDVGQNRFEEIDLIVKGGNYGWNLREGMHDFSAGTAQDPPIDPVAEYGRQEGVSVTGGYVYRGSKIPALRGVYIYADYGSGRIWGLRREGGAVAANGEILADQTRRNVASFGEGPDGEIFVCAFDSYDGRKGRVYRIGQ